MVIGVVLKPIGGENEKELVGLVGEVNKGALGPVFRYRRPSSGAKKAAIKFFWKSATNGLLSKNLAIKSVGNDKIRESYIFVSGRYKYWIL